MLTPMKRFQIIYYVVYGLIILLVIYVAGNVSKLLDSLKDWGWYTYYSELPGLAGKFFYFVAISMIIGVAIENYFRFKKGGKQKSLEREIMELKAKLYDQEMTGKETNPPVFLDNTADHLIDEEPEDSSENTKEGE